LKHIRVGILSLVIIGIVITLTGIAFADPAGRVSPAVQGPDIIQKPGSIQVISSPQMSSVSVDGLPVNGFTPITITGISPGPISSWSIRQGFWTGQAMSR
jgi:hypothetical protein